MRRNKQLDESGINFIGTGVSGGELGALQGPSMMPGGQKEAQSKCFHRRLTRHPYPKVAKVRQSLRPLAYQP